MNDLLWLKPQAYWNVVERIGYSLIYMFDYWSIGLDIAADVEPLAPFIKAVRHNFNKTKWDVTHLEFEEIVQEAGFVVERYEVITMDGYVNTLFRVYDETPKLPDG